METNNLINYILGPRFRVWRHTLFILCFVIIAFNMVFPTYQQDPAEMIEEILLGGTLLSVTMIAGMYVNKYVLVPRLLMKTRIVGYMLAISFVLMVLVGVSFLWDYISLIYYETTSSQYNYFSDSKNIYVEIVVVFFLYAMATAGSFVIVLFRHWNESGLRKNELEAKKLQSDLECLKDQIRPSFLFRILEKAQLLTTEEPEQASVLLMLLSKQLRYQLYDCNREKVLLVSEIAFMDNFLKLRQLCQPGFTYSISTVGRVHEIQLPPLLFVPWVEYAASYQSEEDKQSCMHLHFGLDNEEVEFICISSKSNIKIKEAGLDENSELINIKRRMDLLYNDLYEQVIAGTEDTLTINVRIQV